MKKDWVGVMEPSWNGVVVVFYPVWGVFLPNANTGSVDL